MKNLCAFLFLLLFSLPICAEPLKAGISFTVETARQFAFDNEKMQIDISSYKKYFTDCNFDKNKQLLTEGKSNYKDRYLYKFSDNNYGIRYKDNRQVSFYYNDLGQLISFDLTIGKNYPKKTIEYDINGKLVSITFNVTRDEQYVFDLNKRLITHWVSNYGYNEKGELEMTRDY